MPGAPFKPLRWLEWGTDVPHYFSLPAVEYGLLSLQKIHAGKNGL